MLTIINAVSRTVTEIWNETYFDEVTKDYVEKQQINVVSFAVIQDAWYSVTKFAREYSTSKGTKVIYILNH